NEDSLKAVPAVAVGDGRAEEALFGHPPEQLAGKAAVLVPAPDIGEDLRLGERAGGLLDEAGLGGEREVDHWPNASGGERAGSADPSRARSDCPWNPWPMAD